MSTALAKASGRIPAAEGVDPAPISLVDERPLGSPRFLLYSHDALGLGHIRRNLVIAAALLERAPKASVLLATSADHADSLGLADGVDLLRLPAVRKVRNGDYAPRRLPIGGTALHALREGILAAAVETYRPNVLLVDKHPLGVGGELGAALARLRHGGGRAVLGLRDVLDDSRTVRAEWTPDHARAVRLHYTRVLVYGERSVFDTLGSSALPPELTARAEYCGYVAMPTSRDVDAACTIRGFRERGSSRPLVLATTGGGEDGRQLLDAFVEAAADAPWDAIAVAGPQLAAPEALDLRDRAAAAGVAVRTFVPELAGWFSVADALVCMGGYNTLVEALARGVPIVCVPRIHPRLEQLMRAHALARRGLLRVLEPAELTPESLRDAVTSALAGSRPAIAAAAQQALGFGGAAVAAESLLVEAAESSGAEEAR